MAVKLTNVKRVVEKYSDIFISDFLSNVKVKTGTLMNSLAIDIEKEGNIYIHMLKYGLKASSWNNEEPPSIYLKKKMKNYTEELTAAFVKDLKITIKNIK